MAAAAPKGLERIVVLTVGVLILVAPILWIGWSLTAASEAAEAVRLRSETVASLRERLSAFTKDGEGDQPSDAGNPYLPGETPAIAGATLQRIVADTVAGAGGRLAESEIMPASAEADPGRVNLRVAFEADIIGLQRVLFELETGVPILMLDSISVLSAKTTGQGNSQGPMLRVVMRVGGYRNA